MKKSLIIAVAIILATTLILFQKTNIAQAKLTEKQIIRLIEGKSNQIGPLISGHTLIYTDNKNYEAEAVQWSDFGEGRSAFYTQKTDLYKYDLLTGQSTFLTYAGKVELPRNELRAFDFHMDKIIWQVEDKIYLYDLLTDTKRVLFSDTSQYRFYNPTIYRDLIAYIRLNKFNQKRELRLYDLSTGENKTLAKIDINDGAEIIRPAIWGDKIAWENWETQPVPGGYKFINVHDLSTNKTKIIAHSVVMGKEAPPGVIGFPGEYPINIRAWEGKLFFNGDDGIYVYDLVQEELIKKITQKDTNFGNVAAQTATKRGFFATSGQFVVYRGEYVAPGRFVCPCLYLYNLATGENRRIVKDIEAYYLHIEGDRVFWERDGDIFVYNGEFPTTTTSSYSGIYHQPISVTLRSDDLEADIYYSSTSPGKIASAGLTKYTQPISIRSSSTLNFYVQDKEGNKEPTRSETYKIVYLKLKGKAMVTGAGLGGGPHIRGFDKYGRLTTTSFMAYHPDFRGGVNVATGDINGDGKDEIIAGAGPGGGPHVRVFSSKGKYLGWHAFPFHPAFRGGVNVAAGDVDSDGKAEIGVCQAQLGEAWCKVYKYNKARTILGEWLAYPQGVECGASIDMYDIDNDKKAEVITGAGMTRGPHIRAFEANGRAKGLSFFAYDKAFRGGVNVAWGNF